MRLFGPGPAPITENAAVQVSRNSYLASLICSCRRQRIFIASRPSCFDIGAAEGAFFFCREDASLFHDAKPFFIDAMVENEPCCKKG